MAKFEDLDGLLDDCLELPVNGKVYRVAGPSAEDGLRIEKVTTLAMQLVAGGEPDDAEALDDDDERNLYRLCLGDTYDELLADRVSWVQLRHVALTALVWINSGTEQAGKFWSSAGNPETQAPNRAERRAAGSAAAKPTRSRGSTSGTSRNPAGRPRQRAQAS